MNLVSKSDEHAVLDNVFEKDIFEKFHYYFNSLDFAYRSMTGWQKVWRISDGLVLAGAPFYASKHPYNCMMDSIIRVIGNLAEQHFANVVGKKEEDWNEYFLTPYIYPAGTKISWHNDFTYSGAAIFYTHKFWNPNWGGELFLAKTSQRTEEANPIRDSIDRDSLVPLLNEYGMGSYFSPLPNRLIFTKGKVWHSINRVDSTAGDAVRSSIVAFFVKGKKENAVR
jgi:hypothetical protein